MKTFLILTAFSAISVAAQPAQKSVAAEEKVATQSALTERALTDDEVLKLSLANSQMEVLKAQFGIAELEKKYREFQEKAAPIVARQEAIIKPACVSVGVAEEKIKSGECQVSLGIGADGIPLTGADGKPIPSKVTHAKPQGVPQFPVVEKK
jgi:hypothetical protein